MFYQRLPIKITFVTNSYSSIKQKSKKILKICLEAQNTLGYSLLKFQNFSFYVSEVLVKNIRILLKNGHLLPVTFVLFDIKFWKFIWKSLILLPILSQNFQNFLIFINFFRSGSVAADSSITATITPCNRSFTSELNQINNNLASFHFSSTGSKSWFSLKKFWIKWKFK